MMQVDIHDVGHGACSVVTFPDGARIMIDCGCDPIRPWWPSIHYYGQYIDALVIQNLDEDHVQDLPDLWRNVRLGSVFTNPTVGAEALSRMYGSQETNGWYRSRVKGIPDLTRPVDPYWGPERRHVLTTRRDGTLHFDVHANGRYMVTRSGDRQELEFGSLLSSLFAQPIGLGTARNQLMAPGLGPVGLGGQSRHPTTAPALGPIGLGASLARGR